MFVVEKIYILYIYFDIVLYCGMMMLLMWYCYICFVMLINFLFLIVCFVMNLWNFVEKK